MAKKFPPLIHVTFEEDRNDSENGGWFQVNPGGVFDLTEHGQTVAIYKLVEKGRVQITKKFVNDR